MRILALNPFHAGSHRAMLEGWRRNSRHDFTMLTLPGRHWKWRMRHAAMTFADQIRERPATGFDCLWTTDYTNVAELRGLLNPELAGVPIVLYFHENQFTYPNQSSLPRDDHFAFTNVISACASHRILFNSQFHLDTFYQAAESFLRRMPDYAPLARLQAARERSTVAHPGIDSISGTDRNPSREPGPLRIVWVGRWEHDKRPDLFFDAMTRLKETGAEFRLSVLGESWSRQPECFAAHQELLADHVDVWGYQESVDDYLQVLRTSDVVVSTADHEFFGIAILEAVAAGCVPVLPNRLAYQELFSMCPHVLYDSHDELVLQLSQHCAAAAAGTFRPAVIIDSESIVNRFAWPATAARMDGLIDSVVRDSAEVR